MGEETARFISEVKLAELTEVGGVDVGNVDGAEVHLAGEDVTGRRSSGRGRGTFVVLHVGYHDGAGGVGVAVARILVALL